MFFEKKIDFGLWIKSQVHSALVPKNVDKWAKTLIFQAFPVENPVEIVGNCGLYPLLHIKSGLYSQSCRGTRIYKKCRLKDC